MIPKTKRGRKPKYAFATLKVGECLKIKKEDKLKATQAAYGFARRNGNILVQRAGGREIWRSK